MIGNLEKFVSGGHIPSSKGAIAILLVGGAEIESDASQKQKCVDDYHPFFAGCRSATI